MKTQRIIRSTLPDVPVVRRSLFQHLLGEGLDGSIGGFPGTLPAFTDAATSCTLSRADLRILALRIAYGLTSPESPVQVPLYASKSSFRTLKKGDTVLIYSPNSIAWPPILFGVVAAGLRCTLANSAYTPRELQHQFEDSRAVAIFVHPSLLQNVLDMFKLQGVPEYLVHKRIILMGTEWLTGVPGEGESGVSESLVELLVNAGQLTGGPVKDQSKKMLKDAVRFDGGAADETVYLCYSSGTTGKPKGVETTHTNINALVNIVSSVLTFSPKDIYLGVLPFFHIYGVVKLLHFPLRTGSPVVIMPRFDPVAFCANIAKYKVTVSLIVPPVLIALLRHPAPTQHDMRSLKLLFSGAAPLGGPLVSAVRERLASVGADVVVTQGYGLTETSPTSHVLPSVDSLRKVGTIGQALPNLECRLVQGDDDDDAVDVPVGSPGELWIRGPTVMKGYLNNPTATRSSITPQRWFRTGDIAIVDDEGFFTIVDRRKELIKYKGFQVPPAELESVLLTHPGIADAAVIGIQDEKEATELPRAYIVAADPEILKDSSKSAEFAKSIGEWIKTKVARHKFLRGGVFVIDIIPKSAAGKILRRELRVKAAEEVAVATKAKL